MKRFLNPFCVTQVIQRVRQTHCVLVSLFMALLLSANAFAAETVTSSITIDDKEYALYTGFTATAGTYSTAGQKDFSKMVDGIIGEGTVDPSSTWHPIKNYSEEFVESGYAYLEFSSDVPIILKGYILNSWADGWVSHPTDRRLYAKANEEDTYELVSDYTDDKYSGIENYFSVDNEDDNQYRYFRFEGTNSNLNFWLREIRLYGENEFTYGFMPKKSATCTAIGYKQDCYLRSDGKYFTDETGTTEIPQEDVVDPIVPHTFLDESGETLEFCSICGGVNLDHNHGYCGDPEVNDGKDVTWRVTQEEDGNYTLKISGTGRMADYGNEDNAPWRGRPQRNYLDKITKFVVEEGVTSVGVNACYKWGGLKDVKLPNSITEINPWAFGYCSSLESINIPYGVTTVGYSVFYDCTALTKVEIPCSLEYASYWNIDESVIVKYHAFENQPFIDGGDGTHYKNCKCGNTTSTPQSHEFTVEDATIEGAKKADATCTEKAKYYKSCVCGVLSSSDVFEGGEPLDHSWGEYTLDGDQTCTNDGHKTAKCTREGCSEENKIVATGAALGHLFTDYASNGDATCFADGTKSAKCDNGCGETNTVADEGSKLDHTFGPLSEEADSDGLYEKECIHHCGNTIYTIKDALGEGKHIDLIKNSSDQYEMLEDDLVLNDNGSFSSPVNFNVRGSVAYSRMANKDTMTIILPYDVPASDVNGQAYQLASFDGQTLKYEKVNDGLKANVPYLIYKNRGGETNVPLVADQNEATVHATATIDTVRVNEGKTIEFGAFTQTVFLSGDNSNEFDFYGYKNGKFIKAKKDITVSPFRVAVRLTKPSMGNRNMSLRSYSINPNELGVVFDDDVTGVDIYDSNIISEGKVNVYDVLGRAIRLNVDAENCLDGLKDGVYVVNGNKVIIKTDK